MIIATIIDYLNTVLTVEVSGVKPSPDTGSYCLVKKTGGGGRDRINESLIVVKSYGDTLAEAAALNEQVKTAMDAAIVLDEITKIEPNTDYDATEPGSMRYCYNAVFNIYHY